ncbi:MAG: leucine-rich repeat domain-containing protein [Treponema sp.]|nr:leucine-rich repeat domain-containing protein [Treponema sp.]
MKKCLLLIVAFLIILLLEVSCPACLPEDPVFENFSYQVNGRSITITGYSGSETVIRIPETIQNLPVIAISSLSSWQWPHSLTSVTIPSSVTAVKYGAFSQCRSLTSISVDTGNNVFISRGGILFDKSEEIIICYPAGKSGAYTIPSSVTTIADKAFSNCNLTSVTIPLSVTAIGQQAFYYCKILTNVTIPLSVTTIKDRTFYCCSSLTSVTIPLSITAIEDFAFSECESLTSVIIPSSVTTIGDRAFGSCDSLTDIGTDTENSIYVSVGGVLFDKSEKTLICFPAGKSGVYTIPSSVNTVDHHAFWWCNKLTSVTIPSSVNAIGPYGFWACYNLTSVTFDGTIASSNFSDKNFNGNLRTVYLAGGKGTYVTENPGYNAIWTKQ